MICKRNLNMCNFFIFIFVFIISFNCLLVLSQNETDSYYHQTCVYHSNSQSLGQQIEAEELIIKPDDTMTMATTSSSSIKDTINHLESMVKSNYLLKHDLLKCFENGLFKDSENAAKIFAENHFYYSKHFIDYLMIVSNKITNETIKKPILENIAEENGNYEIDDLILMKELAGIEPEWYNHIPHKYLSKRFVNSLGINLTLSSSSSSSKSLAGVVFTDFIFDIYKNSNPCEALAIIGFAIEETVSTLYNYIWNGLKLHTNLLAKDYVFFPLHILIDDGHADLLKAGFKYYLLNQPYLCKDAERKVKLVLNERIKMFDEVRLQIEKQQNYRCPLPYSSSSSTTSTTTTTTRVAITTAATPTSTPNEDMTDINTDTKTEETIDSAVTKAKQETNKMFESSSDDNNLNKLTLKQKMSISSKILAKQGHGDTLSGQISCRVPNSGSDNNDDDDDKILMYVNKYGKLFELLEETDFVLVNGKDLSVISGNGFPSRATRFHYHIYKHRPDIKCIVHSHPLYTSILSMIKNIKLFIEHMDVMAFYESIAYLDTWPGIPFGDEEGDMISKLLSSDNNLINVALLANHGLIACGNSIESATYRAYFFEMGAEITFKLMSAVGNDVSRINKVNKTLARQARDWRMNDGPVKAHFNAWSQTI